jgi:hypothetical protein
MFKYNTATTSFRWSAVVVALSMLLALVLPALQGTRFVQADVLQNRSVTISTSVAAATDVTYTIDVETAAAGDPSIEAMVVQYCDTSPIIGDATCGNTRSFSWFDTAATDIVLANQAGVTDWEVDTGNTTATKLILSRTGGAASVTTGTTLSVDVGAGGGTDGVDNPTTANDDFFLRILVYATDAGATSYVVGTPGTTVDDGGIALSTAAQINIEARVAERLTFNIGADADGDDCGSLSGTNIDLGVLDSSSINRATTDEVAGNTDLACATVVTNAANGVTISYFGDNLKVTGASCGTVNDDGNTASAVDQCLNYDDDPDNGTTTGPTVAGTEGWGLGISGTPDNGTTTDNLTEDAKYDLDDFATTNAEFAFDANVTTQIASSTTVVDDEALEIEVGGTAEITTPTGLYQTTLTFIATSTF